MGAESIRDMVDFFAAEEDPDVLSQDSLEYDRSLREAGIDLSDLMMFSYDFTVMANTSSYVLPDRLVKIVGAWWDGTRIDEIKPHLFRAVEQEWRDRLGTPEAWVQKGQTLREILLVPTPESSGTLTILYQEAPSEPERNMDLVMGLRVLAREFELNRDRRDIDFVRECLSIVMDIRKRVG